MTSVGATILLVDSSQLHRHILRLLFQDTSFVVVGECTDPAEARDWIVSFGSPPDIVLMDISATAEDDLSRLLAAPQAAPATHVVTLDARLCPRRLGKVLNAGARGYLVKDISPAALVQSLELVLTGERVFPTDLAQLLLRRPRAGLAADDSASPEGLTNQDMGILTHLMNGRSNKEIALSLKTTEAHIKVILKRVLRKINAANRTQAAIWAKRNGIQPVIDVKSEKYDQDIAKKQYA
ncbi:response regulator [Azospirillum melinis]|uniref:Response regulator n=1 Tax=Azospirillum melinis TaxID=328839 RepID=A0ABX2K9I1_9PROT|nr:response regulator transcription factor [Azospirillum melinis]MBP2306285.1 two-component system nitrate/nitrite response regulator NarL [Azospirillum melinis]NUB00227.1 response regulator [Azospirillum melinis]